MVTIPALETLFSSTHIIRRLATMGEIRINVTNFLTIGLMAFVAVFVINKGLDYAGKPQFKA